MDAGSLICAERNCKVRKERVVEVTVGKRCDLVFAAELHRQPVELIQLWCYRVSLSFLQNEPSCDRSEPSAVDLFVPQANRLR